MLFGEVSVCNVLYVYGFKQSIIHDAVRVSSLLPYEMHFFELNFEGNGFSDGVKKTFSVGGLSVRSLIVTFIEKTTINLFLSYSDIECRVRDNIIHIVQNLV